MHVQLDRFEDGGWAILNVYPDAKRRFDLPCELLPSDASVGDVFKIGFEHDRRETERLAEENQRLMDGLLGRDEG